MSAVYENWERLVTAILRREELWRSALRTPSDLSLSASFNSSSNCSQDSLSLLVGESFTYFEILKATECFKDSNLINHGRSGDLYLGILGNGIQVVVKNVSSGETELGFMSEMEVFRMVKPHSRLIPLLGYCLRKENDEKFLVYKYMPNKDLSRFLNGENNVGRHPTSLDWKTRLKIATGAAGGLCYLHHECSPQIVHRDIHAGSILLDDEFEVRLGCLSGVCIQEKDNQNRIARLLGLPRGSEQRFSGASNATCAYDVCCFGKVLLELVTGKLIVGSVNDSATMDWIASTLRYIISNDKKLILKIVDSSLGLDDYLLMEVWAVAFVAKTCLHLKPSRRPKIAQVLKALEETKLGSLTARILQSTGHPSAVLSTPDPNIRIFNFWELKDATTNFGIETLLGNDEFGRVFLGSLPYEKSISKSGTQPLIAVKRMNLESTKGLLPRKSEVELLGRLSHPNILKLLGYCWEDDELFLVYEFMQNRSLKDYLTRWYSQGWPLSWDTRLWISIGAARGLAFLHALERQGLCPQKQEGGGFFGYFKCSKILIDSDYNAKITGFGVAEVDPPQPLKFVDNVDDYASPEYLKEGKSQLESDVYGFGVVLIRLLAGDEEYYPSFTSIDPVEFVKKDMDPRLGGRFDSEAAIRMAHLAQLCLRNEHEARPSMEEVVEMLEDIGKN